VVVSARWRAVKLHVLYRICATENTKFRPEFYSKSLALKSFLAALSGVDAVGDVQFLCDGPVPADLVDTMRPAGVIVDTPGLGNSGSYRRALAMFRESTHWKGSDLVYFAEDDYLYRPNALRQLCAAARAIRRASFFTPYDHPDYSTLAPHLEFRRRHTRQRWTINGRSWRSVRGTTMTFAARVGAMRRTAPVHELWSQGEHPLDWQLWTAVTVSPPFPRRRAVMVAPCPSLATHLEQPFLAVGVDWPALAREYGQ
jgi:hypothetical protein